jgi:hypothetical protein
MLGVVNFEFPPPASVYGIIDIIEPLGVEPFYSAI